MLSARSFIALRHRNFRLIWIGLLVSFSGSMMQNAALLWHVSLLVSPARKGLALGLVGLARVVPVIVFSLISGVVADAWDRRRLMLFTQTAAALTSLTLAALTFRGLSAVWPLYGLAALGSAVGAFDLPARNALVPTLVPREHLPNAISLNTIMFQTASVVGPSVGGVMIAATSVGWVYAVNAISFLFVIAALLMMRDLPRREQGSTPAREDISFAAALEGLRFVFRSPLIRSTMLLDPLTERIERRGRTLLWAVGWFGAATVVFGVSRSFWLTFFCLAMTGATDTVSMIIRNVVRQLETPDRLRGRMTGVNMVFFMGGPQLGELEAGAVANWFGAPFSVISGGVGCLIATAWVAVATPALRHYRRSPAEHLPVDRVPPLPAPALEGREADSTAAAPVTVRD